MKGLQPWLAIVVLVIRALLLGGLAGGATLAAFDVGPFAGLVDALARTLCASL